MFNLSNFARHLAALGIDLPGPLADVAATRDALGTLMHDKPANTFRADLLAGKVNAGNAAKLVRQAAADHVAHQAAVDIARDASDTLDRLDRRALHACGDQLVEAIRPTFDQAVADTAAFVTTYGADPTPEAVLSAGPEAAAAWAAYLDATGTLERVLRVTGSMFGAGYYTDPNLSWYLADPARLDDARNSGHRAGRADGLVALLAAGYPLRLNTREEARALLAGVHDTTVALEARRQAEKDAAQAERKAELQRQRDTADEQRKAMLQR